jgi:hypothetical protein
MDLSVGKIAVPRRLFDAADSFTVGVGVGRATGELIQVYESAAAALGTGAAPRGRCGCLFAVSPEDFSTSCASSLVRVKSRQFPCDCVREATPDTAVVVDHVVEHLQAMGCVGPR